MVRLVLRGHKESLTKVEVVGGKRNASLVILEPLEGEEAEAEAEAEVTEASSGNWTRYLSWGLVGLGVVGAGVGGYFVADAFSEADAANEAVGDPAAHDTHASNAESSQTIGWAAVGGGVALVATGVVLLLVDGGEPTATPIVTGTAQGFVLRW